MILMSASAAASMLFVGGERTDADRPDGVTAVTVDLALPLEDGSATANDETTATVYESTAERIKGRQPSSAGAPSPSPGYQPTATVASTSTSASPVTAPPTTASPVTSAPVTVSQSTVPAVVEGPVVTKPPVTSAPITVPAVTQPPVSTAVVTTAVPLLPSMPTGPESPASTNEAPARSTSDEGATVPLWVGVALLGLVPLSFFAGYVLRGERLLRDRTDGSGKQSEPDEAQEAPPDLPAALSMLIARPLVGGRKHWWSLGAGPQNEGDRRAMTRKAVPIPFKRMPRGGLLWVASGGPAGGVFTEKVAGHGEDAEPTFLRRSDGSGATDFAPTFIGVYDGLGGSGARKVQLGSTEVTQAYLASRWVRDTSEAWFMDSIDADQRPEASELHDRVCSKLVDSHNLVQPVGDGEPAVSRVRSRMQRSYPTTLAAVAVTDGRKDKSPAWTVEAMWAGDSRCYIWTATHGLQQLSADHSNDADILGQLVNDGPMTNVVSMDNDWFVDVNRQSLSEPFFAFCASDGVHGYVRTPGALEWHLLRCLIQAKDTEEWLSHLAAAIEGYTGDDATFALASFGFKTFKDLKLSAVHSGRAEQLERSQLRPFDAVAPDDTPAVRALQLASWETYRPDYTARLPPPRSPEPTRTPPVADVVDVVGGASAMAVGGHEEPPDGMGEVPQQPPASGDHGVVEEGIE